MVNLRKSQKDFVAFSRDYFFSRQDAKAPRVFSFSLCGFTALRAIIFFSRQDAKAPRAILYFLCVFATLRAIFLLSL
ncbi:MAG: hypothetical protein KKA07_12585 [Bacteroidetes bacterium]|nr:hypothetical protein [Bacteroidota bacterium]